jgi:hypothetical protein
MVDVEMFDVVGWQLPDAFLTDAEMEDGETATTVSYHCIKDAELHTFVLDSLNGKPVDESLKKGGKGWEDELTAIMYSLDIEQQSTGAPPMTAGEKAKELCLWLVEEVQALIESAAQDQFESKNDGSYWDGEY